MSAYFGPAGNSESFAAMKFKGTLDVPKYIEAMGLDANEYQCGRGVNIGEDKAIELGRLAAEKGIPLVREGNVNKISVSLHSYEANSFGKTLDEYLDSCVELSRACAEHGTVCALRLWNKGYKDTLNGEVIKRLKAAYPEPWNEIRSGYKLSEYVFLEYGEHFEWPDGNGNGEKNVTLFCHGLRNQIGILCDGTVVPCCLASEGSVALGNLLTDELDAVLTNGRAKAIYDGFSAHTPVEELCRSCGYAKRFL